MDYSPTIHLSAEAMSWATADTLTRILREELFRFNHGYPMPSDDQDIAG